MTAIASGNVEIARAVVKLFEEHDVEMDKVTLSACTQPILPGVLCSRGLNLGHLSHEVLESYSYPALREGRLQSLHTCLPCDAPFLHAVFVANTMHRGHECWRAFLGETKQQL